MALDRGALSENIREVCQLNREELMDAIRAYNSAVTDYNAHSASLRKQQIKVDNLERQLSSSSDSDNAALIREIEAEKFKLGNQEAQVDLLSRYLQNYEHQIRQLQFDFDQNACNRFFSEPHFTPSVPTS